MRVKHRYPATSTNSEPRTTLITITSVVVGPVWEAEAVPASPSPEEEEDEEEEKDLAVLLEELQLELELEELELVQFPHEVLAASREHVGSHVRQTVAACVEE